MGYPPRQDGPSGEPGRNGQRFELRDFLAFRYLITPGLVTVIYVIGAVFITLAAILALAGTDQPGGGLLAGILILVFGNLYWRVILEFVMVLFRINDSLGAIERRGRGL